MSNPASPLLKEESRPLEPARLQFIERTFHEFLNLDGNARGALIRQLHRRLFVDGVPVETVRLELSSRMRGTRLLAVTSGKGGVGKTTFSVNLAIAFAKQGLRVLLFDADLGMANVHIYTGVNPTATLLDVIDGGAQLNEVVTSGPGGIHLICGSSGVARMANPTQRVLDGLGQELLRVAADFDVLVMDTGAGISSPVMRFVGMAQDAIVVTTPNLASILDAYGVIKVVHENRFAARIHVVVNQTEEESQAGVVQERIARCTDRFLRRTPPRNLGCLFHDESVEVSNQSRLPLQLSQPGNVNARRIASIAEALLKPEPAQGNIEFSTAAA